MRARGASPEQIAKMHAAGLQKIENDFKIYITQTTGESPEMLARRVADQVARRIAGAVGFSAGASQGVIGSPAAPGTP